MKLTVNVDGGARGNPGPSAIGIVVRSEDGGVLLERGEKIGDATNNVAEYKALIAGIALAKELGADQIELIGDSELVINQILGRYKVKNAGIKPLHAEAKAALANFDSWAISHVRREMNADADRLVNEALDA